MSFSYGMDLNVIPQGEGSPSARQAGWGSFPCPEEMGLEDEGTSGMGGMKDGAAHLQLPADGGQFLICSAPSLQKMTPK